MEYTLACTWCCYYDDGLEVLIAVQLSPIGPAAMADPWKYVANRVHHLLFTLTQNYQGLVNSKCRDSADTQYVKYLKISKTVSL